VPSESIATKVSWQNLGNLFSTIDDRHVIKPINECIDVLKEGMSSSINDSAFAFIGGVEEANIVRL